MTKSNGTSKLVLKFTGTLLQLLVNIIVYAIVIVVILRLGVKAYTFSYQVFGSTRMETIGRNVSLVIEDKESSFSVAGKLELSKVIPDKYSFWMKTKLKDYKIVPGTYQLNTSMDYDDILAVITNPEAAIDPDSAGTTAVKTNGSGT